MFSLLGHSGYLKFDIIKKKTICFAYLELSGVFPCKDVVIGCFGDSAVKWRIKRSGSTLVGTVDICGRCWLGGDTLFFCRGTGFWCLEFSEVGWSVVVGA